MFFPIYASGWENVKGKFTNFRSFFVKIYVIVQKNRVTVVRFMNKA